MDFSYRYTDEQESFRARVSEWLDANAPADGAALLDSAGGDSALADAARRLGAMGWLAPSEPPESGGAALDADLAVPLLEEMNGRGLLFLAAGEAQALRTAMRRWRRADSAGPAALRSLARGETAVWRQRFSMSSASGGAPVADYDSIGVSAEPDADGYILNGAAQFSGIGRRPDILWTLALVRRIGASGEIDEPAPVCVLVSGSSEGLTYSDAETLAPSAPKAVRFNDVWALRSDALGAEGEGHLAISEAVSLDARADLPSWAETETDALLAYARSAESGGGEPLGADPIRARILVEAYIASRVARLLRMSAADAVSQSQSGGDSRSAAADSLSSLWRARTASELADAARQVVGPRASLSADDPNAADGGRFDRLSRRELAERDSERTPETHRETIAAKLRLGERR